MSHLRMSTQPSFVLSRLSIHESLHSFLLTANESFVRPRVAFISGYKHTHLEGSLAPCQLNKTIGVSFPC